MKNLYAILLMIGCLGLNSGVFAYENITNEVDTSCTLQKTIQEQKVINDDAPVWAEYVAPKYRNPRADFSKKASISELVTGIVLTELIITSPIGIPMTIHGTTKVKMVSYNNRKNIFDEGIAKARLIQDDEERAAAYKKVLKKCHLKESTRKHYAKKEAKALAKVQKGNKNKK